MPLELHPLQEADVDAYTEIMWQAFRPDVMGLMYPNGYTDAAREHSKAGTLKTWRKHPEKVKKLKVIDTALPDDDPYGKIVGVSDWLFYPKERTEAELAEEEAESKEGGFPPDSNHELLKAFFPIMTNAKKDHLGGKPHIRCHILVTHPHHHRRGAGAMQLRWGFEQADKLGVPVWLEASPIGRPLYEREGFETVGWLPFDARDWGSEKELRHALMIRQPKTADTVNGHVK